MSETSSQDSKARGLSPDPAAAPPGPRTGLKLWYGAIFAAAFAGWFLAGLCLVEDLTGGPPRSLRSRIHRVETLLEWAPGGIQRQATTPLPLAEVLEAEEPEIERVVRVGRPFSRTVLAPGGGVPFNDRRGVWADESFFELFGIPFVAGDRESALRGPRGLVLSESLARRCFPAEDALGKTVRINRRLDFQVTGVFRDRLPGFRPEFSFVVSSDLSGEADSGWAASTVFTYIRLRPGASPRRVEEAVREKPAEHGGIRNKTLYLKFLSRVGRDAGVYFEFAPFSVPKALWPVLVPVCLVLLSVWVGLFSSASLENGRGKTLRDYLVFSGIALIPAAAAAWLLAPGFLRMMGRAASPVPPAGWALLAALTLGLLAAGVLIGFLGRSPAEAEGRRKAAVIQWFLRLLQWTAAGILLLLAVAAWRSAADPPNEERGMRPEALLTLDLTSQDREGLERAQALRGELLKHPHILNAAFSLRLPFETHGTAPVGLENGGEPGRILTRINLVNADFYEAFGLELTPATREAALSIGLPDGTWACLINQAAAAGFGEDDRGNSGASLVGKSILFSQDTRPVVVGVVRDFPFTARGDGVEPLILVYRKGAAFAYPRLTLRLDPDDLENTLEFVETKFDIAFPDDVFERRFFEQTIPVPERAYTFLPLSLGAGLMLLLALGGLAGRPGRNPAPVSRRAGKAGFCATRLPGILLWTGCFLGVLAALRPSRLYLGFGMMTRTPLFNMEWNLAPGSIWEPGRLVSALAGFLGQFLARDWLGALVFTALAGLLTLLLSRLVRGSRVPLGPLVYLPALLMLMYAGRYENPLEPALGLAAAMAAGLVYRWGKGRRRIWRWVLFGLLFGAVYIPAGGAALLFAAAAAGNELLERRDAWSGLAVFGIAAAVPAVFGLWIFDLAWMDIFARHLPIHPLYAASTCRWVLWGLALSYPVLYAGGLLPRRKHSRYSGKRGAGSMPVRTFARRMAAVSSIFVFAAGALALTRDQDRALLHEIIARSRARDWAGVLEQARRFPPGSYNLYSNYQINRALFHLGRLGDEMFAYPQNMDAFALIPFETERFVMRDAAVVDVSLELGALNIAEHLCLELLEVAGASPSLLRDLALINLAKDQPESARVYLEAMARDPVFRPLAFRWLDGRLDTPHTRRIQSLRSINLEKDTANIQVEGLLVDLLERNPYNRMAFEYLMAFYLMERRLDKVIEYLDRLGSLGYRRIPRHYEEAVLLHMLDTGEAVDLHGFSMSPDSVEAYREFARIIGGETASASRASPAMRSRFGRSYFYYYSFNRSGVSE